MNIQFDIRNIKEKLKTPWNFGVNSCHAILWTRNDLNRHAKIAAKECGFRYIRFHNIISRQIGIYTEDEKGTPQFNFEKFDTVFDNVIASGYIPFFEISFCPDALSDKTNELCFYKANTSLPNSFEKWSFLVKKMVEHIIDRYGLTNVNDIPKSSFHAFSMLNKITGYEVCAFNDKPDGCVRAMAALDEENNIFRILLYYYKEPTTNSTEVKNVEISVFGIESESVSVEFETVNDESGSAYEWWRSIGSPEFINSENLSFLLEKSKPVNYRKNAFKNRANGDFRFNLTFAPGDFTLMTVNYI